MMISPPLLAASLSVTIVTLAVVALSILWWLSRNTQVSAADDERERCALTEGAAARSVEGALDEVEAVLQGAGLAILREVPLVDKRGEEPLTRVAPLITVFDNALWLLSVACAEERAEGGQQLKGAISEERWSLMSAEGEELGALKSPLSESLATLEVIKTIAHAKRLRDVRLQCGVVCFGAHPKLSGQHKSARVLSLADLQRSLKTKGTSQTKAKKQLKKTAKKRKESPSQQQQEKAQEELKNRQLEQARALWRLLRQRA